MQNLYLAKCKEGTKAVELVEADGFQYYRVVELPEITPTITWHGPKIAMADWRELMAFFEAGYEKTKSEQQAQIYFSRQERRFKFWVYPQRAVGMSTQEIENHPKWSEQAAAIGGGYINCGSVHHHCKMQAYQSSTDTHNETVSHRDAGVHITVGHIGSEQYDLDGRVCVRGGQSSIVWSQWFEPPAGIEEAITELSSHMDAVKEWKGLLNNLPEINPAELREKLVRFAVAKPPAKDITFPSVWMENLIEESRISIPIHPHAHSHGWQHRHMIGAPPQLNHVQTPDIALDVALDAAIASAERNKICLQRAVGLLEYEVNIGNVQPQDMDDAAFLEEALGIAARHKLSLHTLIELLEAEAQMDVQAWKTW